MKGVDLGNAFSTAQVTYTHGANPEVGLGLGKAPNATNSWLQNSFLSHDNGQPIYPMPYFVNVLDKGMPVGIIGSSSIIAIDDGCNPSRPTPPISQLKPGDKFQTQWLATPSFQWSDNGSFVFNSVIEYGPLYSQFGYSCTGGGVCKIPVVRGMTHATAIYPKGSTPSIDGSGTAIISINGQPVSSTPLNGQSFTIEFNNQTTWTLTASTSISLNATTSAISIAALGAETILRMAENSLKLPAGSETTYPLSATVVFKNQVLSYSFNFQSMNSSPVTGGFHFFLPIHLDFSKPKITPLSTPTLNTPYGDMALCQLSGATPNLAFSIDLPAIAYVENISVKSDVKAALKQETANFKPVGGGPGIPAVPADPYGAGKTLSRAARLAAIANQAGDTASLQTLVNNLQGFLQEWLDGDVTYAKSYIPIGERTNQMRYETQWGGIVTSAGLNDSGADFGEGWYNDHHFHWGYFYYALAIAVKYDQTGSFLTKNKEKILYFVRDVMNPSTSDPCFTVTRNKDWWTWQSFASGLFISGNSGRNQESCGEAINCYYGAALLGDAMGNNQLKELGQLMLAMETQARDRYYFYTGSNEQAWWADAFKQQTVVGIHYENLRQSSLFWCINAPTATLDDNLTGYLQIQVMPYTPVSRNDVSTGWFTTSKALIDGIITNSGSNLPKPWLGYMDMLGAWAAAQANQPTAAFRSQLTQIPTEQFDSGNSLTNGLFWIDSLG